MIFVMRKDQFIEAADRYAKRSFAALMILMLLAAVCMAAYSPFRKGFEAFLNSRFPEPTSDILAIIPMALPITVALGLLVPLERRLQQKLGLPCPHCGKSLATSRMIVVASKNCPHCGMKVLDDNL
jgi:hypothetical protein